MCYGGKGEQLIPNHGVLCSCGWAGKRLPPKPGLGSPRDGVCQLWGLERDGDPGEV